MAEILSNEQRRARTLLQTIGWKWDHETYKKGTLILKVQPNRIHKEELETKGYSLQPGVIVAEILSDGRVKMGEIR